MRIDKYLQTSRIIKRRAVAKELIENKRVLINSKIAKPASNVEIGDLIEIQFGDTKLEIKVLQVLEKVKKDEVNELYEIINRKRDNDDRD